MMIWQFVIFYLNIVKLFSAKMIKVVSDLICCLWSRSMQNVNVGEDSNTQNRSRKEKETKVVTKHRYVVSVETSCLCHFCHKFCVFHPLPQSPLFFFLVVFSCFCQSLLILLIWLLSSLLSASVLFFFHFRFWPPAWWSVHHHMTSQQSLIGF